MISLILLALVKRPSFQSCQTALEHKQFPIDVEISEDEIGILFSSFRQAEKHLTTINKTNGHGYEADIDSVERGYWIRGGDNLTLMFDFGVREGRDFQGSVGLWKIPKEMCSGHKFYVSGKSILGNYKLSYKDAFERGLKEDSVKEICIFVGADSYDGLIRFGNAAGKTTIVESDGEQTECLLKECARRVNVDSFFIRYQFNEYIFKQKNKRDTSVLSMSFIPDRTPSLFIDEDEELLRELDLGDPSLQDVGLPGGNFFVVMWVIMAILFVFVFSFSIRHCIFKYYEVDICPCIKCFVPKRNSIEVVFDDSTISSDQVEQYTQGQPYPAQQYPNQQYPNQPFPNQPYPNQPYPNQPYPNQPYPNQPYPNQPYPNQPYPNQPYPNQPYPNQPNPPQEVTKEEQPVAPTYQPPVVPPTYQNGQKDKNKNEDANPYNDA